MADQRFYPIKKRYNLEELSSIIDCQVGGNIELKKIVIKNIAILNKAEQEDLSFLSNPKYITDFYNTKAVAVIVPDDFSAEKIEQKHNPILLYSKNPYLSYTKAINLYYHPENTLPRIEESAYIHPSSSIGKNCSIGHNVVIEQEVTIGDNSVIESGTIIKKSVVIGNNARIGVNVTISYAIIGDDVVILDGAKIGQDGFGFATDDQGQHHKIFHTGLVIIGNNVEIGSNTTIDRGSLENTVIGDFCRIDNLVQIAHNVTIGRGAIIVAQVGIAGSTKIGNYCVLGGQVGVAGHLTITDKVQAAGQSGIIQDINTPQIVGGTPAVPIRDWHRQSITLKKLIRTHK